MLRNNATFQIVGPSGCGKTHFVCHLLLHRELFTHKFGTIWWHQGGGGEAGLTRQVFKKLRNIKLVDGFPPGWMKRLKSGDVIVIDDLYQEANKESDFNNLFTKIARHQGVTVIFITQNLFHQGGQHRTRNLNCHYLALFKNPRDQTAIDFVARQAFPHDRNYLIDAYRDATRDAHGYIFIDFTQQCPDNQRVKTDIFNTKGAVVYKQSKTARKR